jgi:anti-anti-sigma factor
MPFAATSSRTGGTALITLEGELDALTAPTFQQEMERAANGGLERLVLDMAGLTYLSSAGLRALVFARQKMEDDVMIVLVSVSDEVEQTIRMVGFHRSVTFSNQIPD